MQKLSLIFVLVVSEMLDIKIFVMAKFQPMLLHHLSSVNLLKLKNLSQLDLNCLIIKCLTQCNFVSQTIL